MAVDQQYADAIKELAQLRTQLAEVTDENERLRAALESIIKHTTIAVGAKACQMSTTACIARRALSPEKPALPTSKDRSHDRT